MPSFANILAYVFTQIADDPERRHRLVKRSSDSPQHDFYVWADAVCINQDNIERSQQVQLTARIYTSASYVVSWLGPKDQSLPFQVIRALAYAVKRNQPEQALLNRTTFLPDWLRHISRLCRQDPDQVGNPFQNAAWEAIADLLRDPYWDRIWIFQEVALAHQLSLLSTGDSILLWNDLESACISLGLLNQKIAETNAEKPEFIHDGIWSARTKRKFRWERIRTLTMARIEVAEIRVSSTEHKTARWDLSACAADLRATDHRDYIYGLSSVSGIPIYPNYDPGRTLSDLYTDYVYHWLEASLAGFPGLDISALGFLNIAGVGHFGHFSDFHSWAPNYPKNNQYQAPIARISIGVPQQDVFPNDLSKSPILVKDTKSLWAWGIDIDALLLVSKVLGELDERFFTFVTDFISRHRQYVGGIPPLQAILRLLARNFSGPVTKSMVLNAFGLLVILDDLDRGKRFNFLEHADFEKRFAELLFRILIYLSLVSRAAYCQLFQNKLQI
ncbi:hypothetical protein ACJ41O_003616 [Fusarium nematophilum]